MFPSQACSKSTPLVIKVELPALQLQVDLTFAYRADFQDQIYGAVRNFANGLAKDFGDELLEANIEGNKLSGFQDRAVHEFNRLQDCVAESTRLAAEWEAKAKELTRSMREMLGSHHKEVRDLQEQLDQQSMAAKQGRERIESFAAEKTSLQHEFNAKFAAMEGKLRERIKSLQEQLRSANMRLLLAPEMETTSSITSQNKVSVEPLSASTRVSPQELMDLTAALEGCPVKAEDFGRDLAEGAGTLPQGALLRRLVRGGAAALPLVTGVTTRTISAGVDRGSDAMPLLLGQGRGPFRDQAVQCGGTEAALPAAAQRPAQCAGGTASARGAATEGGSRPGAAAQGGTAPGAEAAAPAGGAAAAGTGAPPANTARPEAPAPGVGGQPQRPPHRPPVRVPEVPPLAAQGPKAPAEEAPPLGCRVSTAEAPERWPTTAQPEPSAGGLLPRGMKALRLGKPRSVGERVQGLRARRGIPEAVGAGPPGDAASFEEGHDSSLPEGRGASAAPGAGSEGPKVVRTVALSLDSVAPPGPDARAALARHRMQKFGRGLSMGAAASEPVAPARAEEAAARQPPEHEVLVAGKEPATQSALPAAPAPSSGAGHPPPLRRASTSTLYEVLQRHLPPGAVDAELLSPRGSGAHEAPAPRPQRRHAAGAGGEAATSRAAPPGSEGAGARRGSSTAAEGGSAVEALPAVAASTRPAAGAAAEGTGSQRSAAEATCGLGAGLPPSGGPRPFGSSARRGAGAAAAAVLPLMPVLPAPGPALPPPPAPGPGRQSPSSARRRSCA